ncbi:MAG: protein phosphatase 2C domain-containing protein [Clostridium sp.]|jgi:serine/threonine protein phosphatase PrpC|nr:protein phosphatase 2C domain-containing protein [Clostridium sp.]
MGMKNIFGSKKDKYSTGTIQPNPTIPQTQSQYTPGMVGAAPVTQAAAAVPSSPISIGNIHHVGARESQQDSFGISDISNQMLFTQKGVFGVVADGMGGMTGGGEASGIAVRTLLQYFNEALSCEQPQLDLLNMIGAANDNVNRYMEGSQDNGGSTVVAVIIRDGYLYWISVGDSRIYLLRGGALIQINRDHTYAVELDEKAAMGEISWEEAADHPKRVALTSYLGMGRLEKIDRNIRPVRLQSGDRVILMSDGVFGTLTDEEMLYGMRQDLHETAAVLQEMILKKEKRGQDNFTAIIFAYQKPEGNA